MPVFRLDDRLLFPPVEMATVEGLLAFGGDLSVPRLLLAYRRGIFPWFAANQPILWWAPDPRLVLFPQELHVARSLRRLMRQRPFALTVDVAFDAVIERCAAIRRSEGTWIVPAMVRAYADLHRAGFAHSVEVWQERQLVGGLYGVALGSCFFGESMFSEVPNASKVALVHLVRGLAQKHFDLIDCQVTTAHLVRFGAREIPRREFMARLKKAMRRPTLKGPWHFMDGGL